MGNAVYGIYVAENASPTLDGNRCSGNGKIGIAYFDSAGGRRTSNESTPTAPTASMSMIRPHRSSENECSDNDDAGIAYFGEAQVRLNAIAAQRTPPIGIYVAEAAAPILHAKRHR